MAEATPVLLACFVVAVGLLYHFAFRRRTYPFPLPPGPKTHWIPYIGNALDMAPSGGKVFPTKLYEWGRQFGEIYTLKHLGNLTMVLTTHRAAKELLEVRGSNYSSRTPMPMLRNFLCRQGNIAFEPYGEEWRRLRRETHRELNITQLNQYGWIQEREAYFLAQGFCERPNDILSLSTRFGGAIALGAVYDKMVTQYNDPLIDRFNDVLEAKLKLVVPGASYYDVFFPWFSPWLPDWIMPSKATARLAREESERLDIEMRQYVEQRLLAEEPTTSFMASLLKRLKEGDTELSPFLVDSLAGSIMAAAGDTSSASIHQITLALVTFPDVQAKLQAYIDKEIGRDRMPCSADIDSLPYVRAFVLESTRWRSVSRFGVPHCSLRDDVFESNGTTYFIPAGTTIIANGWSIERDEAIFPEPEQLRPERYLTPDGSFNSQTPVIGFGFGRRICPGQNLAVNSLIMAAACMAWSFNFTKKRDLQGRPIEPNLDSEACHDGGSVFRLKKFEFERTFRGPEVEKMIYETVKESAGI